jgi:hypothetical protein
VTSTPTIRTGDRVLVTRTNSPTAKLNPSLTQRFVGTIAFLDGDGELADAFNLTGHEIGGRDINRIFSSAATLQRCYGCTQTIEPAPEN